MKRSLSGLLTIVAIALAGCGGEGESTDPVATGSVSKQEFIGNADLACKNAGGALAALSGEINDAQTFGDSEAAADAAGDLSTTTNDLAQELRGLPQPEQDAETLEAYVEALDKRAEIMGAYADALRSSDQAEADRLANEFASATDGIGSTDSAPIAIRFGFTVCR